MNIDDIIEELTCQSKYFDLEGVEMTREDALYVIDLINGGMTFNEAIVETLNGIYECLM